jgi:soluble lytic murein transglycosylase-like protein
MIKLESNNNKYAVRYEDLYQWTVKPYSDYHWYDNTEEVGQKTSWGYMQIMGGVARKLGFEERFLSQLVEPKYGIKYGCIHLKNFYDKYGNWQDAISSYNQGSPRKDSNGNYINQNYVDKVLEYWNEEGGK